MSDLAAELENLYYGPGKYFHGWIHEDWAAEAEAMINFPGMDYCLIREWIILDVEVEDAYRTTLESDGLAPVVIYAANVMLHSSGKRHRGDWVRSTFQRSFSLGYLFQSVNTVYVLLGSGMRKTCSGRAVLAICR